MQEFQPNTQQQYQNNTQQEFQPNTQQQYPPNTSQLSPPNIQQPYPQTPSQQGRQQYQYHFTEKQMHRYFLKPSRMYTWLVILGAILLFLIITSGSFMGAASTPFLVLGLALLAIGGIPLFIHYTQRPSSEQYERWVAERSQSLYGIAIQRLHILDETLCTSIVEVQGAISSVVQLAKKFPEKETVVRRLPNGLRHYSINMCTYIFLVQNKIGIYSGYINAFSQQERFEDADNYYYKDIVGVSTSGPIYIIGDGYPDQQRQGFFVRINNGDVVGTDYATKVMLRHGGSRVQIDGVDDVVAALLKDLRDHSMSHTDAITNSKNL